MRNFFGFERERKQSKADSKSQIKASKANKQTKRNTHNTTTTCLTKAAVKSVTQNQRKSRIKYQNKKLPIAKPS